MMSPKTDHPAHIRWRSLLRRGRKESASDSASSMLLSKVFFKYLILLTFDNFPDVKLHVEIWIFAVLRKRDGGEKNEDDLIPSTGAYHGLLLHFHSILF